MIPYDAFSGPTNLTTLYVECKKCSLMESGF